MFAERGPCTFVTSGHGAATVRFSGAKGGRFLVFFLFDVHAGSVPRRLPLLRNVELVTGWVSGFNGVSTPPIAVHESPLWIPAFADAPSGFSKHVLIS